MGRLLDKLIVGTPAYEVVPDGDGFMLLGKPDRPGEFNELVREATEKSGAEFLVFPAKDDEDGYSHMFVLPLD